MFDRKTFLKKLIFPPRWLVCLLGVVSTVSLTIIFVKRLETHPIAYAVYAVSFYALSVLCALCSTILPRYYKTAKQIIVTNKYGNRYLTDAAFRTHVSLYVSLTVNLLYVGVNVLSGFLFRSAWFGILAGYYIILSIMRFLLVRYVNRNIIGVNTLGEWKRSRVCASVLTLLNLVLSGAILMIMYQNKGFVYHGILVYVMAVYTFYITVHAIINIIKYRKYNSPILYTTKIISLAAALVSMLSLETAMLTAFGADTSTETKRILIAATGAGISIVVVAMSGYMIARSTKEINNLKEMQQNE